MSPGPRFIMLCRYIGPLTKTFNNNNNNNNNNLSIIIRKVSV